LLRWLDDPEKRWLAREHENLAKLIERGRRREAPCTLNSGR
jgi:hypothetical protein